MKEKLEQLDKLLSGMDVHGDDVLRMYDAKRLIQQMYVIAARPADTKKERRNDPV